MEAAQGQQNIGFVVVGMGRIGRRHAAIIQDMPHAALNAVVDTDPKALQAWEAPAFRSLEDFLNQPVAADIVAICTPNGLHYEQAKAALLAGYHVLIEKPMALCRPHAEDLIHTALQQEQRIFCVMQNRYSPPSQWAKEVVESGRLGSIYLVQVNCFWNRDERYYTADSWHGDAQLDGGTLFTQFSHFIDTLYWLFGDIHAIQARFSNFNHSELIDFEDSGLVQFALSNGGQGTFQYSTSNFEQNLESSLTVIGEKGSFKIGGQYMEQVVYCHIKDYQMPELQETNPPNSYGGYTGSAANHIYVYENIFDTLLSGKPISTNAMEGLKVVDIIERIYAHKTSQ